MLVLVVGVEYAVSEARAKVLGDVVHLVTYSYSLFLVLLAIAKYSERRSREFPSKRRSPVRKSKGVIPVGMGISKMSRFLNNTIAHSKRVLAGVIRPLSDACSSNCSMRAAVRSLLPIGPMRAHNGVTGVRFQIMTCGGGSVATTGCTNATICDAGTSNVTSVMTGATAPTTISKR